MTLHEAFEAMRPQDQIASGVEPRVIEDRDAFGFLVGEMVFWRVEDTDDEIPDSLAESAICWAMVKALATRPDWIVSITENTRSGRWSVFNHLDADVGEKWGDTALESLSAAYASAFPKEKA